MKQRKQSNSRIIRWNDGSLSLQLGSEIFDIATDRSTTSNRSLAPSTDPSSSFSTLNQSQPNSVHTIPQAPAYLVTQHGYAQLLESQAIVSGSMTFRPTAIQSASHRKVAQNARQAAALMGQGKNKVQMIMAQTDPELESQGKSGAKGGKGSRKARAAQGEAGFGGKKSGKRKSVRSTRLDDFSDGEGEEDSDGIDLAAERKKSRARDAEEMDDFLATDSDEDVDSDAGGGKSSKGGRKSRTRDEEEAASEDEMDDLERMAEKAKRARAKGTKQQNKGAGGKMVSANQRDMDSDDLDAEDGDDGDSDDVDNDARQVVKKKLVVESDEDE